MARLKNPVSEADAVVFDAYVQKWQSMLGLQAWRIERGGQPAKHAMASVEFNLPAMLATYRLGDFGGEAITPASLENTAIHELLHVLLLPLIDVAAGKSTDDELDAAEHAVINTLEKLLRTPA